MTTDDLRTFTASDPRRYVSVAATWRETIEAGKVVSGDPLPSINIQCEETGFSRQTVGKALRLLESQGLIYRVPGLGYFVA